jgi:hypothetical protein
LLRTNSICGVIALVALIVFPASLAATQREGLLKLSFGRAIPAADHDDSPTDPPRPLLVYVCSEDE